MVVFERPGNTPRYVDTGKRVHNRLPPEPEVGNEAAVEALLEYRALEFNGRPYLVPPIEHSDGVRIMRLQRRRQQLDGRDPDDDTLPQYEQLLHDIVSACGPLLVPMGWHRWIWKLRRKPNPLLHATEGELGAILDFLAKCRMMQFVRLQLVRAPRRKST